jgi:hypothetical protein
MMAWKHAPIVRTIPFLLAVFLFNFSAQAQYSGGNGTADDPYQIATAADLIGLGNSPHDYDKHFILTTDIDLDPSLPGRRVFDKAVIASLIGVFDGNGHTISHLTIKGKECLALFAYMGPGAQVRNLGIVDVNITNSGDFSGGLAARNLYGRAIHCYSIGIVGGHAFVGGLIGGNQGGALTGCHSAGVVTGTGDGIGGLAGWCVGSDITDCNATATVAGNNNVGGLMGTHSYECVGEFRQECGGGMIRCHSTGPVTGTGDYVGGLIGNNSGAVTQCYSTGVVQGNDKYVGGLMGGNSGDATGCYSEGTVSSDEGYVGGLTGWNNAGHVDGSYSRSVVRGKYNVGGLVGYSNSGRVIHCYSTGAVSATTVYVGGLMGNTLVSDVTDCFWDLDTSGQSTSAAGLGKTTAKMQTAKTFLDAGWDFIGETANGTEDLWSIDEGKDYPRLWWETTGR